MTFTPTVAAAYSLSREARSRSPIDECLNNQVTTRKITPHRAVVGRSVYGSSPNSDRGPFVS